MVKINVSDEVYNLFLKNGKSIPESPKTLIIDAANKGDPLTFLDANEPLSPEAAETITAEVQSNRKKGAQEGSDPS
jgi:hypothetical protein